MVSHHLSVISVQASLARYVFYSDPDTARQALHTIGGTTTESLDELRRLLRVLRPPHVDPDLASEPTTGEPGLGAFHPQPGLADLPALVSRVRAAGVRAELTITGQVRPLPSGQELCAYRIAQEALTNVIKHAGPVSATLELDYRQWELTLRVTDIGRNVAGAPNPSGHGLVGMRERANMYGGMIEVGPRPEGGFGIELRLPYPPAGDPAAGAEAVGPGERTE